MNTKSLLILVIAVCFLGMPLAAQVSDSEIEVTGTVTTKNPTLDDQDKATAVALRAAVESALDKARLESSLNRVARALIASMNSKSLGDFASVKSTSLPIKGAGDTLTIRLVARINAEKINQWLAQINHFPNKEKRIMIVVPEHHLQGPIPDPAGETEILRIFTAEGFKTVDQKQVKAIRDNDLVQAAIKGDPKELIAIAKNQGADLVLVGEAFSQDTPRDRANPKFPARARIEGRIIKCDTGEIVTAGDATGGAEDLSPAVADKAAIRAAAGKLANQMLLDLLLPPKRSASVHIVMNGADFESKSQLKQLLMALKGIVTEVKEGTFAEGRAEMDVVTTVASGDLADALFLAAKKDGWKLKVVEQTAERITLDSAGAPPASPTTQKE